jgi:predicted dehydrogenase
VVAANAENAAAAIAEAGQPRPALEASYEGLCAREDVDLVRPLPPPPPRRPRAAQTGGTPAAEHRCWGRHAARGGGASGACLSNPRARPPQVYICSRWDMHVPHAVCAMEAGKHAAVEVTAPVAAAAQPPHPPAE